MRVRNFFCSFRVGQDYIWHFWVCSTFSESTLLQKVVGHWELLTVCRILTCILFYTCHGSCQALQYEWLKGERMCGGKLAFLILFVAQVEEYEGRGAKVRFRGKQGWQSHKINSLCVNWSNSAKNNRITGLTTTVWWDAKKAGSTLFEGHND